MRLALAFLLLLPLAAKSAEDWSCRADGMARVVRATLAATPAILSIPAKVSRPPILLWHGFGPPAGEADLQAALPLDDVPAVKVYLGLPLFGKRAPGEGELSLRERQSKDYGLLLFGPAAIGAASELPAVVEALRQHHCLEKNGPVSLFGFSASGASVLTALAERKVAIDTAILVNPSTGLTSGVAALERATGHPYEWNDQSRALAARSDGIGRAKEIASGTPALLIVTGIADSVVSSDGPRALNQALAPLYGEAGQGARLKLVELPGLGHDWTAPEARGPVAAQVSDWLKRHP